MTLISIGEGFSPPSVFNKFGRHCVNAFPFLVAVKLLMRTPVVLQFIMEYAKDGSSGESP